MIPQEIKSILEKYQDSNSTEIQAINNNIQNIIRELKSVRKHLSLQLHEFTDSETVNDKEDELFQDLKILKKYINGLEVTPYKILDIESLVTFTKNVHLTLISDDLCPACNVKLIKYQIYYQRRVANKIKNESVSGYRCPTCNHLFVADYEIEDFNFEQTNIIVKKSSDKIAFQDTIVIFNINKCSSHNHAIEDIKCNIPIIVPSGEIVYAEFPIIHCKTCKRYIMLKSTYDTINGIPACIVIDESKVSGYTENDFLYGDSSGSKLHQYGYNVNCQDNLTVEQRHTILSMQLLSGNITKGEICSILDTNINRGSNRQESKRDWSKAVTKWKADKEYVLSLDLEKESERIGIDKLILKYRK